jgi:exonuclease III
VSKVSNLGYIPYDFQCMANSTNYNLRILYTNADQFPNKMHEILIAIGIHKPDIIMITEVLPKNSATITTKESIDINGFELFTNIETEKDIRGIAVYIRNHITASQIMLKTIAKENIWCELKLKDNDTLLLGCIYRSPTKNNENTDNLCKLLIEAQEKKPSHVLIVGDFNYPEIDWENVHTNEPENHRSHTFIKTFQDLFLYQHTTEHTRYREGHNPSLLDLIITNEEGMVNKIQYLSPLGKSDHICISFDTNMYAHVEENDKPRYAYHRGNYTKMTENLRNINWDNILDETTIGDTWTAFQDKINQEMRENIPKSRKRK